MTPQEQINQLTEKLNELNFQYYQNSNSEVSDYEFDMMLKHLHDLEIQHPQFVRKDSPTHRVGGTISKQFESVTHKYPMLSLGNTYNEQDLAEFDERIRKGLGDEPFEYICELKFDGVALSMWYENGVLIRGVTRGDGVKGDDITTNVKTIRTIPLQIRAKNMPSSFEVRGEGFMPLSTFEALNKEREDIGEQLLANPRNAASGTFKMQDSGVVAKRKMDCYIYQFLSDEDIFATHEESLIYLKKIGFNVSPTWEKCNSMEEVTNFINRWNQERHNLPLNTDGIVIKINSFEQRKTLGFTSKSPRWAISYKYKSEAASTLLESVSYQVGRTGNVTPVANLKPVHLAGTTVKRASIHNANEIERLDLHIGDYVFVEKGGEIIPKITNVDLSKRDDNLEKIIFPHSCPECGTELIRKEGEANHYCPNDKGCPPQIKGKIEHFIQRKALNIENLGTETIEMFYQKGLVRTPADLYDLQYENLLGIEGFKEKSIQNILSGVQKSKEIPFKQVLFGIGIRFVGATVAEKLAAYFNNIDALSKASQEELLQVPEIGERIAQSVVVYFQDADNQDFINRLKNTGLQFQHEAVEIVLEGESLAGKTFVISGTFQNFERDDLKIKIEANGGKVLSGVSGKLNFLVAGSEAGPSKIEKANKLGVKIISEEEFLQMLES
ncbi:MAG: NAD-dependent DNA ligase LigA [Arcicella sp.]|nr:NAD-dependent DNA ligase LigA [Arcicella sp.]